MQKPGNILWRPQHLEWTLIDFGCAAQTGAHGMWHISAQDNRHHCRSVCILSHAALLVCAQDLWRWLSARLAGAGTEAPLAFSPRYAAPEVLIAFEAKKQFVEVSAAQDIWSVGEFYS